ncbi:MAG: hypothetical protein WBE46_00160, partial [Dehalococcoidia bacterium]
APLITTAALWIVASEKMGRKERGMWQPRCDTTAHPHSTGDPAGDRPPRPRDGHPPDPRGPPSGSRWYERCPSCCVLDRSG